MTKEEFDNTMHPYAGSNPPAFNEELLLYCQRAGVDCLNFPDGRNYDDLVIIRNGIFKSHLSNDPPCLSDAILKKSLEYLNNFYDDELKKYKADLKAATEYQPPGFYTQNETIPGICYDPASYVVKKMDTVNEQDEVNEPEHYKSAKGIECIDYIKQVLTSEQFKGFCHGNVIKYQHRYAVKNGKQDLEKAGWYLRKMIDNLGGD